MKRLITKIAWLFAEIGDPMYDKLNKLDYKLDTGRYWRLCFLTQFFLIMYENWRGRLENEEHVGCYSYPCCDENPNGCRRQYSNAEPIGHRG